MIKEGLELSRLWQCLEGSKSHVNDVEGVSCDWHTSMRWRIGNDCYHVGLITVKTL